MAKYVFDLSEQQYQKKFTKTISLSDKNTDGSVQIKNDVAGQISYKRVGNNVEITVYKLENNEPTTTVLGKITIKNFGLKKVVAAGNVNLTTDHNDSEDFIINQYELGDANAGKKVKINGTYLNEIIYGGKKNDTIYATGGTTEIQAGQGDDIVYGGVGNDRFIINKCDATIKKTVNDSLVDVKGAKGDTIYNAKTGDRLIFSVSDSGSNSIEFNKVGNNFVVDALCASDGATVERATLVNFFKDANRIQDIQQAGYTYHFGDSSIEKIDENTQTPVTITDPIINVKGNAKKDNKLVGTQYGDTFTGGSKKDTITTGNGNDVINLNGGKDVVNVNGSGKKTLVLAKSQDVTVNITNSDAIVVLDYSNFHSSYRIKSNDDLIVTFTSYDDNSKKYSCNVTIKNYFKSDGNKNIKWIKSGTETDIMVQDSSHIELNGNKKKSNVLNGSDYGDYIRGGDKKDIITTGDVGSSYDDIVAGKGNDEIIINGTGNKFITIGNGDGHDTVRWDKNGKEYYGKAYMKYSGKAVLSYGKSQNEKDLIIYRTYDSGKTVKTEQTTIKDYFVDGAHGALWFINSDYAGKYVNSSYEDISKLATTYKGTSNKANDIELTADKVKINKTEYKKGGYNDILYIGGSKKDVVVSSINNTAIFTGAGDDIVTVDGINTALAEVHTGLGKDTLNIATEGDVLYYFSGGKDTINFTGQAHTLYIDANTGGEDYKFFVGQMTGKYGYRKSGDDLIYSTIGSDGKTGTITISDYFTTDNKPETIKIGLSHKYDLEQELQEGVWAEGVYDPETKTTTYDAVNGNYRLFGYYKGSGRVVLNGSTSESGDWTLATLGSKSDLTINSENGGGSDNFYLTANYKNMRAFFNVDSSGAVACIDDMTDNFLLFNKSSLTVSNIRNTLDGKAAKGVININNFFDDTDGQGAGYMDSFYVSSNMEKTLSKLGTASAYKTLGVVNVDGWIDSVSEKVGAWLSSNGYDTSMDVLYNTQGKTEAQSAADISAMLKVYQGVNSAVTFYG